MLRVGIISDTHLRTPTDDFKLFVDKLFRDADIIVHAGDITGRAVYDYLSNWDLRAVRGNMDDPDLRDLLPEKRVETLLGKKIGIIHGRGAPYGLENLVLHEFQEVDLIIFGHTHTPLNIFMGHTALFNPGSWRDARTVGIIEIEQEIRLHHVKGG
jgi:uncharacterized protein